MEKKGKPSPRLCARDIYVQFTQIMPAATENLDSHHRCFAMYRSRNLITDALSCTGAEISSQMLAMPCKKTQKNCSNALASATGNHVRPLQELLRPLPHLAARISYSF